MKKYSQKIVCSVVVIAIIAISVPSFSTKKVEAASITGYIQDLTPVIAKLPGCAKIQNEDGTTNLWKSIKGMFKTKAERLDARVERAIKKDLNKGLKELQKEAKFLENSIPTNSQSTDTQLVELKVEMKQQSKKLDETKKSLASLNKHKTCLDSIGKAVVKLLINKFTESTVEWIRTGNNGGPMWVQHFGTFMGDIAKEQIMGFGIEIDDEVKFPFGKQFMQSAVRGYNNKFQNNAQYSLNEIIKESNPQFSVATFNEDFSMGGWPAWNALTQYPQNNPLGFQIMASQELQSRLAGTEMSVAQQINKDLDRASGWLSPQKCANPKGLTKEEDIAAINAGVSKEEGTRAVTVDFKTTEYRRCLRWETVTPGAVVGSELTDALKLNKESFVSADTLNDAVAAILDAVLARFSSELMETGLADTTRGGSAYDLSAYEDGGLGSDSESSRILTDFSDYQRDASGWLRRHPDFNIRADLNQALIDEQRIYVEKLQEQSNLLMSTTDGKPYRAPIPWTLPGENPNSNAKGIIPTINQLDYCIPGPHPGWEDDAQEELDKVITTAKTAYGSIKGIEDAKSYSWFNTLTLGLGPEIMTWVNSLTFGCNGDTGEALFARDISSRIIQKMTGLMSKSDGAGNDHDNILNGGNDMNQSLCTPYGFEETAQALFDEYIPLVEKHFNLKTLPSVAREAQNIYDELDGYEAMLKNNEGAIMDQTSIIKKLEEVKIGIDNLNETFADPSVNMNEDDYEIELKVWIDLFARISTNLISGDDIAQVDNTNKEIKDETEYVLKNLIQGPGGCEQSMITFGGANLPHWTDYFSIRPKYPKPILYEMSPENTVPDNGAGQINVPYSYWYTTIHGIHGEGTGGKTKGEWWPTGFLTAVPFQDGCQLGNYNIDSVNYSDVVLISKSPQPCIGNILNTVSDHIGGSTAYLEKFLKIY
ncbi:hypothetical protein M0R04_16165 [Candidatus Dojkabacteria bacterium]|jgi:hypothetical protein|nr:hypothetical protein [Candidatus Dojkabacteria bacterium]